MEKLVKGDVVVLPFPFSDLSSSKKRPALVATNLEGNDLILCQITSKNKKDNYSIMLKDVDFKKGGLNLTSKIRPNRLFTADKSIISYKIGTLKEPKIKEIETALIKIFKK
ncbi:type II toxin-antitoxin system PemK/MazF family toxin [Candidatus Woesearchaeota archaeon]|nr:type II toxin-antitoxin system PemK/MazF family toxin [Candidatus Woesearchaeota archaeon]